MHIGHVLLSHRNVNIQYLLYCLISGVVLRCFVSDSPILFELIVTVVSLSLSLSLSSKGHALSFPYTLHQTHNVYFFKQYVVLGRLTSIEVLTID